MNVNYLKNGKFKNNNNGLTTYTSTSSIETVDNWILTGSSTKQGRIDVLSNGVRLYAKANGDRHYIMMYQNVKFSVPNIYDNPNNKRWAIILSGKILNPSTTDRISMCVGASSEDTRYMGGIQDYISKDGIVCGTGEHLPQDGSFSVDIRDSDIYSVCKVDNNASEFYAQAAIILSDTQNVSSDTDTINECIIEDLSLRMVLI